MKRIQVDVYVLEVYDIYNLFFDSYDKNIKSISYQYTFLWYLDFYAFVVGMWWCLFLSSLDCMVDAIKASNLI